MPASEWLTYLAVNTTAGDLDYDLAASAAGGPPPSAVEAGLAAPDAARPARDPADGSSDTFRRVDLVAGDRAARRSRGSRCWPVRVRRRHAGGVKVMRRVAPPRRRGARRGRRLAVGQANAGSKSSGDPGVLGPGDVTVKLTIHHSRFSPDRLRVAPGTTVHFVVDNQDPIDHELIVGDAEVHRRHEAGTEPVHPPRPGEVSVAALTTASTTFVFGDPGSVLTRAACPGHFRYGMSGTVDVSA